MKTAAPSISAAPEGSTANDKIYLDSQIQLVLHTENAIRLLDGEWRYGRMGLIQFAGLMSQLWKSAKADDPYADWYMFKTFDAIRKLQKRFAQYEKNLTAKIQNLRGIQADIYINRQPRQFPLRFATPFAFMTAMLLENVDYLIRQILTVYRLGMSLEDELQPRQLMLMMQELFNLPRQWKYTGVTRQDLKENNQKAAKAKSFMGEIPATVLQRKIKLAFLPKTKK